MNTKTLTPTIFLKKLHPDAVIPSYATEGSAGFDLVAIEESIIYPGERRLLKTGLAVDLPKGYELQIRPRSGLALKHGITVLNSPGTIDSDYRGEIGVILLNTDAEFYQGQYKDESTVRPGSSFVVKKGDRIAQAVVTFAPQAMIVDVGDKDLEETARGAGGFGSTGVAA